VPRAPVLLLIAIGGLTMPLAAHAVSIAPPPGDTATASPGRPSAPPLPTWIFEVGGSWNAGFVGEASSQGTGGGGWLGVSRRVRRWNAIGFDAGWTQLRPSGTMVPGFFDRSHQESSRVIALLASGRLMGPTDAGITPFLVLEAGALRTRFGAYEYLNVSGAPGYAHVASRIEYSPCASLGVGMHAIWPRPFPRLDLSARLLTDLRPSGVTLFAPRLSLIW